MRIPRYAKHVQMSLSNLHRLRERRYSRADYGACDVLLDLEKAIDDAELTDKQAEVIRMLYEKDLTQEDAAKAMGMSQKVISMHNKYAIKKIAKEYKRRD